MKTKMAANKVLPEYKASMLPIDSIKPYFNNPRRNTNAIPKVAESLKQFNWRQPIVVDKNMVIVVGHTRWEAAKLNGETRALVHVADDLSEEQCRAYRIADNRTGEVAEWDQARLMAEVLALSQAQEVDLGVLGFTKDELDALSGQSDDAPRALDNFETMPVDGDKWILMRAPESQCARALNALQKLALKDAHIEYSGAPKGGSK